MKLTIAWLIIAIGLAVIQWYIIEKKKIYPNKVTWLLVRIALAGLFFIWFNESGYKYYWTLTYLVFGFWWPFNTTLNLLRPGKSIDYLSTDDGSPDDKKESKFDHFLTRVSDQIGRAHV